MRKLFAQQDAALLLLCLCLLAVFCAVTFFLDSDGSVDWSAISVCSSPEQEDSRISAQTVDGILTLFLPPTVSPSALPLHMELPGGSDLWIHGSLGSVQYRPGTPLNLTNLCPGEDYSLTLEIKTDEAASQCQLRIFFTSQLASLYLVSDSPAARGREWVESAPDKSHKATGRILLLNDSAELICSSRLTQIKGRGNSTWSAEKKPYQIKLDQKADLLGTQQDNPSDTWLLIANSFDPSLLRNTIVLDLYRQLGSNFGVETMAVNLYYDGEYRGCYLLSEKVEIAPGRIEITDLEEQNAAANPNIGDFGDLPTDSDVTANGAVYTYCIGMTPPDDITGGYLLEIDYAVRVVEEPCYFYTSRGNYVAVKSPEYAAKEEMAYIASLFQSFEDAVYNGGTHPETGISFADYVNLESLVRCYLINELTKNPDGFQSSAYLYKDSGTAPMIMGPVWDYDLSFGLDSASHAQTISPEGMHRWVKLGAELYKLTEFRKAAKHMYTTQLHPLVTGLLQDNSFFDSYTAQLSASAACNDLLWYSAPQWQQACFSLKEFLSRRTDYLYTKFSLMNDTYDIVSDFEDVSEDDWFYEGICVAARNKLMSGVSVSWFDTDSLAKRAHVIQTIYNMEGTPPTSYDGAFPDVSSADWFAQSAAWAMHSGVFTGLPDGSFRPNEDISRQELASLLYRYHGSPEVSGNLSASYSDSTEVSPDAQAAVEWALQEELITGLPDQTLNPRGTVSRAELAVVLSRYYIRFKK